jgi:hypothetical protein
MNKSDKLKALTAFVAAGMMTPPHPEEYTLINPRIPDFIPEIYSSDKPIHRSTPLDKKGRKRRSRNKIAKRSRKRNRK